MQSSRGRLRRAVRMFTIGSGPLKRRLDRVEFLLRLALVGLLLASVPLGLIAAGITSANGRKLAASQLAVQHQVTGELLADAGPAEQGPAGTNDAGGSLEPQHVPVGWTDPDGTFRKALVPAPAGKAAGSSIRVWLDRSGSPVSAPLSATDIRVETASVGMTTAMGTGLLAILGYLLVLWALRARRRGQGGEDWATIEPRWTRRVP